MERSRKAGGGSFKNFPEKNSELLGSMMHKSRMFLDFSATPLPSHTGWQVLPPSLFSCKVAFVKSVVY